VINVGRHRAPTRTTRRLVTAAALTVGGLAAATGSAWAGDHDDDKPSTTCGAMEPGDATVAAPVCAPVDVDAPVTVNAPDLAVGGLLGGVADIVDELTPLL
jgi:anti-sigma factor RsiW